MNSAEGKLLLIANPASQNGQGATAAHIAYELLCEWLGAQNIQFKLTESPGHAIDIARNSPRQTYKTVVALGGDGLVHEVAGGLMDLPKDSRPALGVIPVGSGNDYAKTLGMVECVPDAVLQFLDAKRQAFDVGVCNGNYFVETLSFGLDAAIALDTIERRKVTGKQGKALYMESGFNQLMHHLDPYILSAVVNDGEKQLKEEVYLLAVQIGPTYGGGFSICPNANPMDGQFNLCYVEAPMNKLAATAKFLSAKNGKHVNKKGVNFAEAKTIEISFDKRPPCQIDGEPLSADTYKVSIIPHALDVLVAKGSQFY